MARPDPIPSSEITPEAVYFTTAARSCGSGSAAASLVVDRGGLPAAQQAGGDGRGHGHHPRTRARSRAWSAGPASGFRVDDPMTALGSVANYNNFYEFTTDKEGVAAAAGFVSRPVDGRRRRHGPQARRCSTWTKSSGSARWRSASTGCGASRGGRWSSRGPACRSPRLLAQVEPMGGREVRRVRDPPRPGPVPGQKGAVLDWPYVEGLRLDEAMHPLTILAAGLYGRDLPAQNGAPCGWWSRGSTGSRGSSRSSRSRSCRTCRRRRGTGAPTRPSTGSSRTSTRPSRTRGGARRPEQRIGRVGPAADAPVQRVRRPGRPPVRRHGPEGELLIPGRAVSHPGGG